MRQLNKKYFQSTTKKITKVKRNHNITDNCFLTWKLYDPSNNQFAPLNDGVLIGYGPDDSPQYVGQIITQYGRTPARIVVNGTKAPGGYSIYISKQVKGKIGETFYLSIGPNNYFYWILASSHDVLTNSIKIREKKYTFTFPRLNETTSDGKSFSMLGITILDNSSFFYDIENKTVNSIGKDKVETLVCSSKDSQLSAYEANHDSVACVHEWRTYDTVNDPEAPAKYGIYAGNYIDNSSIYVGRSFTKCYGITPGRIAINGEKSPAVHSSCDSKEYSDNGTTAQFLVYNSSQTYEWIMMNATDLGINNVYMVNDNVNIVAVARINMSNPDNGDFSQIAITVLSTSYTHYYNPVKNHGYFRRGKPVEMLICTPNN
ncbi:hypothetical protein PVAND_016087 [Polypedilum vanderplanki]|uniref:Uncharacterized protein n=1 Tax=Polypedilum vanderplanki TaxID=319348 RepID=A0A9J6BEU2_POLVA|nr:hypothetical protein PVAND_016087 [Polypedilum vanderplanki]